MTKAVVKQEVADGLQIGASGRFYLFRALDIGGIHGVRTSDGRAIFAFPGNNEKLFAVLGPILLAWCVFMIVTEGRIPLIGAAGLVLSAVGWYFMSKGRREAKAQFDEDNR